MQEKIEKPEITDDEAVGVLKTNAKALSRNKIGTHFVTRTIIYPVSIEYKVGLFTNEIRTAVRQYEYCSPAQWERALEFEKKYPKLNAEYQKALKAMGKPVNVKEPGNPLNTTVIETVR